MSILIKEGRVIDPANNFEGISDILLKDGKVSKLAKNIKQEGATVIDASGKLVVPGLIDLHTHLRQPGREDEETFASGSKAAARGGFTTICAMPNTEPVCDTRGAVEYIMSEAKRCAIINILPIGAITVGEKGTDLAEVSDMKRAGIVAISDDGYSVRNSQLMRKALEYASMCGILVISHCEDLDLTAGGVMNEGFNSTLLGLRGIPNASEAIMVARDILLAALTGTRVHIAHVSTKEAVRLIREAKKDAIKITAETCPHYFLLSDDTVKTYNTNYKMNPPLRSEEDIKAVKEALKDSTIDIIATDHAPHAEAEKDVEFDLAPFGIIGLETAFSLAAEELVGKKLIGWKDLISKMSTVPAKILGLGNKGSLSEGRDADIAIIDAEAEWIYKKEDILSKSKNSPFIGRKLRSKVVCTICGGKVVYKV